MEAQARMRAAWPRTVNLNYVDHCGMTGANAQPSLASPELHSATSYGSRSGSLDGYCLAPYFLRIARTMYGWSV